MIFNLLMYLIAYLHLFILVLEGEYVLPSAFAFLLCLIQTASDTPSMRKIPTVDQPIIHYPINIIGIA